MTNKEKAIGLIQSLDDNVSLDDVIDRLYLLRKVELAEQQADRDEVIEHAEFMSQLEAEDAGGARLSTAYQNQHFSRIESNGIAVTVIR